MRILTCTCIALVVLLASCSTNAPITSSNAASSSEMEQQIKAQLDSDQQLAPAGISVSADAEKNQVTLSGMVWSEAMRTQAVNLAQNARSGVTVVDKIDVNPGEVPRASYTEPMAKEAREKAEAAGEKIGKSLEDAWIHTKIAAKLIAEPQTPARKIKVDVVDQVVTLRGEVETGEAKLEAGRIAMATDDVKRVTNLLRVHPSNRKS